MRYSTNRSYRDSVMVEVEKVIKRLETENQKDENFFSSFWFFIVKIYKKLLIFCKSFLKTIKML
jgi:hypothetical protein